MRAEVAKALKASGAEQRQILTRVAYYEDAGPGGFYDDLGNLAQQPHISHDKPIRL